MKEFKVNEFLSVKQERGNSNIYVNDELFRQCKYLMLNTRIDEQNDLTEMESIDEFADSLGWTESGQEGVWYDIDPNDEFWEQNPDRYDIGLNAEFWGYCSCLQTWYEHEYDARLLHSSLAFPLLKKLVEVGDPLARKVFKEQIAARLKSGYPIVFVYIIQEQLLDYFNEEERNNIILDSFPVILKSFGKLQKRHPMKKNPNIFLYDLFEVARKSNMIKKLFPAFIGVLNRHTFTNLLKAAKENNLIRENFPIFLEFVNKCEEKDKTGFLVALFKVLRETGLKKEFFPAFVEVLFTNWNNSSYYSNSISTINSIKEAGWMKEYFSIFLEKINILPDFDKNKVFLLLIEVLKESGSKEEYFLDLLKSLEQLVNKDRYIALYDLIDSIKNTELLAKYDSQIETQFLDLMNNMDDRDEYQGTYYLFGVAKEMEWMEEHFPRLIKHYEKFNGLNQCKAFYGLIDFFISSKLLSVYDSQLETIFANLLTNIENLPPEEKYESSYYLFLVAKESGWLEEHFLEFLKDPASFYDLIDSIKGTKVLTKFLPQIEKAFLAQFDSLDNLFSSFDQIRYFASLVSLIISSDLLDMFYSHIETTFLDLWYKMRGFSHDEKSLIRVLKKTGLIKKQFPTLIKILGEQDKSNDIFIFSTLLGIAKEEDWIEEYYIALLEVIDKISNDDRHKAFVDLITITSPDIIKKYHTQIETKFLAIVEMMEENYYDNYEVISNILGLAKELNLINIKDNFLALLGKIKEIWRNNINFVKFDILYKIAEENNWIMDFFHVSFNIVYELYGEDRYHMFSDLINSFQNSELIEYESIISTEFLTLLGEIDYLKDPDNNDKHHYRDEIDRYYNDAIAVNVYSYSQYNAFNILINSIKSTPLWKSLYPQIKTQFHILLNRIDDLCDSESDMKYKFGSKYEDGCRNLIKAVKGTNLENDTDFKKWKAKISRLILI